MLFILDPGLHLPYIFKFCCVYVIYIEGVLPSLLQCLLYVSDIWDERVTQNIQSVYSFLLRAKWAVMREKMRVLISMRAGYSQLPWSRAKTNITRRMAITHETEWDVLISGHKHAAYAACPTKQIIIQPVCLCYENISFAWQSILRPPVSFHTVLKENIVVNTF
jgi:hypothetical protein